MSLIDLIDEHKVDLAIPWQCKLSEIRKRYLAFGRKLVELPDFVYTKDDMKKTIIYMTADKKFNRHARYNVAAYAMRRAAMNDITDIEIRGEIWELLDVGIIEDTREELRRKTAEYAKRLGKRDAKKYLISVGKGFSSVRTEVESLYKEVKEHPDDTMLEEMAENHGQYISLEEMRVDDVLKLVG